MNTNNFISLQEKYVNDGASCHIEFNEVEQFFQDYYSSIWDGMAEDWYGQLPEHYSVYADLAELIFGTMGYENNPNPYFVFKPPS